MTERQKKQRELEEFISFLKHCDELEMNERVHLEQVFKAFDDDPEIFQRYWLRPLLAEGLNLDQIFELVAESIFCPN
jgi:hypothetical protein